jgi:hypothetical protein
VRVVFLFESFPEAAMSRLINAFPVFVEEFKGSRHCAHIREPENAERYWMVVRKTWQVRSSEVVRVARELE